MSKHHEVDQLIAAVPLFSQLSKRARHTLAEASKQVQHPDGHVVAAEGLGSLAMHVVLEGSAVVTKQGGRRVRVLGPGEYFGEISLIDKQPRSATVTAEGPLTTLAIPQHSVQKLIDDDADFVRHLMLLVCRRLRTAEAALDVAMAQLATGDPTG